MYKSDHELEQEWVRTPRTHPLDTRLQCLALSVDMALLLYSLSKTALLEECILTNSPILSSLTTFTSEFNLCSRQRFDSVRRATTRASALQKILLKTSSPFGHQRSV